MMNNDLLIYRGLFVLGSVWIDKGSQCISAKVHTYGNSNVSSTLI